MILDFIEILKVIFLGIVEGITEWLPISSTGHMLLVDEFIQLNADDNFKDMFFIVIQLGAIMAVVLLFWKKLWPFGVKENKSGIAVDKNIVNMWLKVVVACIPGTVITLAFDDIIDKYLETPIVIASMLIIYGIAFIIVERWNKTRTPKVAELDDITYMEALYIGLFQVLSIIPGTSRSGSTIIGALIVGVSRGAAAEFTFFLAVPVMIGYSALKILKFVIKTGFAFTYAQTISLLVGMLVAFLVSVVVIKFLMGYIKKHDFQVFGWYRIIIGIVVIAYFAFV